MFEETLCFAERGEFCVTFATGMAAIAAAFGITVKTGEEVVCHQMVYGCTYSLLTNWFPRYEIGVRYVDLRQPSNLEAAITEKTRVVYFETPVNPTLDVIDIRAVQKLVKKANAKRPDEEKIEIIVDNTFATPCCQRPLGHGADLVVHSLTKGIGGFGTDMGGAVIGKSRYEDSIMLYRKDFGGALSPKVAWTIMAHGLPTLVLRLKRQQETAAQVVEFLTAQRKIFRVRYPGLGSDPDHETARRQMTDFDGNFAPGSMIYF
jgi:cystathionine beta-lyase/cystathionine gamma-synthase